MYIQKEPSKDEKKMLDHMSKLTGSEFDKEYVSHMVKDHKKDIAKFEDASKNAQDPDVRAFAEKTLPVLREHLEMAQNVESSMKSTNNR
jgi:putative membrane protein